jgi:hypothetical protein
MLTIMAAWSAANRQVPDLVMRFGTGRAVRAWRTTAPDAGGRRHQREVDAREDDASGVVAGELNASSQVSLVRCLPKASVRSSFVNRKLRDL